ncbi:uncharacterized protein LOC124893936 [Capsicum annuum]|nr:uncharacterized protein LOC124893936 [Capsicum annuum]
MALFAIEHSFNYYAKRSDKKSYVLQYRSENCVWIFKASCRRGTELFKVRFFQDVHTCPLKDRSFTQLQATVGFVSGFAAPKLVNYKRIHTMNDIIEDIKNAFGVDINYQKAWRAKERAIEILRGKPADAYRQMTRYVYMLNSVYPGSHIRMHKSEDNKFMYLSVALQPLKSEFEYYRPVVVVDGAHLSGAYKGTFVSASIFDGAGRILPIAYGVVDSENDNLWTWFFENFRIAFEERDSMCVVSDRHESIIKVVSVVYPNVPHLACIWHLWKNVCTNFRKSKDRLSDIYYAMVKAYRKDEFDFFWNQVGKIDKRVKSYLEDAGFAKWARVYAPVNRGRMMTSNIVECINGKLKLARELSIIEFLEQARKLFGKWN